MYILDIGYLDILDLSDISEYNITSMCVIMYKADSFEIDFFCPSNIYKSR